jgi:hypothetical protein
MFGSTHPRPPQEHQPPHPGGHPPHPHPPHSAGNEPSHPDPAWRPPLPTARDHELLTELLGTEQDAHALLNTIQNASPATAAIGYLMLRVLEQTRSS